MAEELLTVEELCDLLKVTRSALYGMRYTRTAPPAIKIGRQLRFRRSDVEAWIAARPAA
jgi:excisionase family DNA binding protein